MLFCSGLQLEGNLLKELTLWNGLVSCWRSSHRIVCSDFRLVTAQSTLNYSSQSCTAESLNYLLAVFLWQRSQYHVVFWWLADLSNFTVHFIHSINPEGMTPPILPSPLLTCCEILPTSSAGKRPHFRRWQITQPSPDSLLAEVFLSRDVNAIRSLHSPRFHLIITLISSRKM